MLKAADLAIPNEALTAIVSDSSCKDFLSWLSVLWFGQKSSSLILFQLSCFSILSFSRLLPVMAEITFD